MAYTTAHASRTSAGQVNRRRFPRLRIAAVGRSSLLRRSCFPGSAAHARAIRSSRYWRSGNAGCRISHGYPRATVGGEPPIANYAVILIVLPFAAVPEQERDKPATGRQQQLRDARAKEQEGG